MEIIFKDGGTKAAKVLVTSNNQICLSKLDELANQFWHKNVLTTSSRVNRNGGYVMFFLNGAAMLASLGEIKEAVQSTDSLAEITAYNFSPTNS